MNDLLYQIYDLLLAITVLYACFVTAFLCREVKRRVAYFNRLSALNYQEAELERLTVNGGEK